MITKTTISAESLAENILYVSGANFQRANDILEQSYRTYSNAIRTAKKGERSYSGLSEAEINNACKLFNECADKIAEAIKYLNHLAELVEEAKNDT